MTCEDKGMKRFRGERVLAKKGQISISIDTYDRDLSVIQVKVENMKTNKIKTEFLKSVVTDTYLRKKEGGLINKNVAGIRHGGGE